LKEKSIVIFRSSCQCKIEKTESVKNAKNDKTANVEGSDSFRQFMDGAGKNKLPSKAPSTGFICRIQNLNTEIVKIRISKYSKCF
jgi:hypothetical protein